MRGRVLLTGVLLTLGLAAAGWATQFQEIGGGTFPATAGAAWGDYDADGYPDLFLAGADAGTPVPAPHGPVLLHNNHNGTFTDVSQTVGLSATAVTQWGVAWGDYDNSGKLDVLVGGGHFPYLYQWDGSLFSEVGQAAGLQQVNSSTYGQSWCDYDGDNLLDAFCSKIFGLGYLMKNSGNGTFADVSTTADMTATAASDAMSAAWGDYNNSGRPSVVLARKNQPLTLYHNNGDGTFTDVSDTSGLSVAVDAQSAIWGDYDNDGWLDLFVTAGPYPSGAHSAHWLFHNNGNGTFSDVSATAGISRTTQAATGAVWFDYDNDGYLDLYVGNWGTAPFLYHNNRDGTFTDEATAAGLTAMTGTQCGAAAAADIDRDGRMDLFQSFYAGSSTMSRLYHNVGTVGTWLRVRALTSGTGDATSSATPTRDAIGARVEVNLDNDASFPTIEHLTLTRLIDGGSGLGENEQIAQFGLGGMAVVAVRVTFPDGSVVVHRGVAANQQIVISDVPAGRQEIFTDVPLDYWAYPQILATKQAGIVQGNADGTYHPGDTVTRDQMAVFLSRALADGDANVPQGPTTPHFSDVATNYWAYKYVEYVYSQNIVAGNGDGTYSPGGLVDRGQMSVFISRSIVTPTGDAGLASYTPPATATFADVPTSFWTYKKRRVFARPRDRERRGGRPVPSRAGCNPGPNGGVRPESL